jgi:putative exporter of polyketide antibiotics
VRAIQAEGLTKRYGETLALDSLDLSIEPGEVYGYLGPNGAGKTTTIRLLLGLHRPTGGRAELFGVDAWADPVAAHRRVAYVAGEPYLWPAMTGAQTLEYAGRAELVLAGVVSRRTVHVSAMAAIGAATLILWAAEFAGFVAGGLPVAGSAYLALATASIIPVFAGIGAVASQIAPDRRMATEIGGGAVGLSFLLRVVADTVAGAGWLRWVTPLGWAEEMRPFAGPRPVVVLLPVLASVLLIGIAGRLRATRDIGSGLIPQRSGAKAGTRLLSSPAAQALRSQRGTLIAWALAFAVFSFILGVVASIGLVPAAPFQAGAAAVMVGIGVAAAAAGLAVFRRRDLIA